MVGLIVLVAILFAMAFVYVWIANMVAREEVSVPKGALILFIAGIGGAVIRFIIGIESPTANTLIAIPVNFLLMAIATRYVAQIGFKESLIIAGIFTVLLLGVNLLVGMLMG